MINLPQVHLPRQVNLGLSMIWSAAADRV